MSELAINYRKGNFTSSANRVSRALNSRYSDYTGIKNRLNSINSSSTYLNTAGNYLTKKLTKIEECDNKIYNFKNNVIGFVEYANGVDKRIASRISQNAKTVYNQVGIKTGLIASCVRFLKNAWDWVKELISDVGEFFENVKNEIVKFYNDKLKPMIDSIMDFYKREIEPYLRVVMDGIGVILGAVALLGAIAAILVAATAGAWIWALVGIVAGAFLVIDSLLSYIKDWASAKYHKDGNYEQSEYAHNISNRDLFYNAGGDGAATAYDIGSIISFIYDLGNLSKGVYKGINKAWKSGDSFVKNLSKVPKVVIKEFFGWKKKDNSEPFFSSISSGKRALYPNGKPVLGLITYSSDKQMLAFLNLTRNYKNYKKIFNIFDKSYDYDKKRFQISPKQFGTVGGIVDSINNLMNNLLINRYY